MISNASIFITTNSAMKVYGGAKEVAGQSEAVVTADNLRFASPATMSRLTVIFLSKKDVDVKPAIAAWIAQQPLECQGSLATLCANELGSPSRSRCSSASDSFRVFRPPGTKPHAYCVVHGCKPPTFPHFLRREHSSLQLLQRHVTG